MCIDNAMKAYAVLVSLLIAISTTSCTIDVKKLKETASPLIQTFHDTASSKLKNIHNEASMKLQNLSNKASSTIQQLSTNAKENLQDFFSTFTLDNLKKLDVLSVLPKIHKLKDDTKHVKFVKVFRENEFLHEKNIYPWTVVKRKVEYIYE